MALACATLARPAAAGPQRVLLVSSSSARAEPAVRLELGRRKLEVVDPLAVDPATDDPAGALREAVGEELQRARQLYYRARIQPAAELLSAQIARHATALVRADQVPLLRDLHLWRGICLAKGGDEAGARAAFGEAVRLGEQPLDAAHFPPRLLALYADVARRHEGATRHELVVQTQPAGARVLVDGRPVDEGRVRIVAGTHWLVVRALGYRTELRRIEMPSGPLAQQVTLEDAPADAIARQLTRAQDRGELDPTEPLAAAAMGRLQRAYQALVLVESADGEQLTLTRVRCADGEVLARVVENVVGDEIEAGVRRAMARIWPPPGGVDDVLLVGESKPIYKRWWFWTAVGVVVAGGVVAAVLATRSGDTTYTVVPGN